MKKFLTILLAVIGVTVTVLLTGCSSDTDDLVAPASEPVVATPVDDAFLPADEAFIAKYQALNDSLAKAWEADPANALPADTRASVFWTKLKIVVKADIIGAVEEATKKQSGSLLKRVVNIILKAVSRSITVGINEALQKKVPGGPHLFDGAINRYAELQIDRTYFNSRAQYWDNKTLLTLPAKYQDRTEAGRYHNIILEMEPMGISIMLETMFDEEQLEYLLSEEFQNEFASAQAYYDGKSSTSPYEFIMSPKPTKYEIVINSFLSAISNDSYQMSNINQVLLSYLDQVDKESFEDDTKQLIQQSFVLGSYSYAYWKDKPTF